MPACAEPITSVKDSSFRGRAAIDMKSLAELVSRLNEELGRVMQTPELRNRIVSEGSVVMNSSFTAVA